METVESPHNHQTHPPTLHNLASFFRRASAILIDTVFQILLFNLPIGLIFFIIASNYYNSQTQEFSINAELLSDIGQALIGLLILVYYIILEARSGQSIGKKIVHIRVVNEDGTPINFKKSFIRNMMRIVDYAFLLLSILLVIFTKEKQRLGDMVAKTIVIYENGQSSDVSSPQNPPQPEQPSVVQQPQNPQQPPTVVNNSSTQQ